jgi:hypothetical protein
MANMALFEWFKGGGILRWVGAAVALAVAVGAVYLVFAIAPDTFWTAAWTITLGAAVIISIIVASNSTEDFLNYFLFALAGGTLGWIVGILASPESADEARIFGDYKTAIVGFLSGFVASKASSLWELLIKDPPLRIFQKAYLNRLLLFAGTFFMLAAQQYITRQSTSTKLWTSATVAPLVNQVSKKDLALTVRPNTATTITFAGAANYENIALEWSLVDPPPTGVLFDDKTLVLTVPAGLSATLRVHAVSQYNHEKSVDWTVTVDPNAGKAPPAAPPTKATPPAGK